MGNENREMQQRKTCKLYAYVLAALGKEVPTRIEECRDSDGTEDYNLLVDCVKELSQELIGLDADTFEKVVKSTDSVEARELSQWWEMYQIYIPVNPE